MIISFCGDNNFYGTAKLEEKLFTFLEKVIDGERVCFYLKGSGTFDTFAYNVCKKYKEKHSNVRLCYVTPYITRPYCEKVIPAQTEKYDMVVYPEIEGKPLRVAILYRNRWMMEIADLAVVYVDRDRGGSYQAYCHAKRKGTRAYDLAEVNL